MLRDIFTLVDDAWQKGNPLKTQKNHERNIYKVLIEELSVHYAHDKKKIKRAIEKAIRHGWIDNKSIHGKRGFKLIEIPDFLNKKYSETTE